MNSLSFLFLFLISLGLVLTAGCLQTNTLNPGNNTFDSNITDNSSLDTQVLTPRTWKSFTDNGKDICLSGGKPVVRLFSTTWCPHCSWIKATFDSVIKEYVNAGKIEAYHWELDSKDNTMTPEVESDVPSSEMQIFGSGNPSGYVPFYSFGCKYERIGNNYEGKTDGLVNEEKDFRELIEKLISDSKAQ
jgi:thiol-disulfide isomerase/thioredoxin